jgi:hypothetical protein
MQEEQREAAEDAKIEQQKQQVDFGVTVLKMSADLKKLAF